MAYIVNIYFFYLIFNILVVFMQGESVASIAKKFNLEDGLIKNLEKSELTGKVFLEVVAFAGIKDAEKKVGNMLYSVTTKLPVIIEKHRQRLAKQVGSGLISNASQLDFAVDYLIKGEKKGGVDFESYTRDCGIGVKLTEDDIKKSINENIQNADEKSNKFEFLNKIKGIIPYADGKTLKDLFDAAWASKGLPDKPVADKKVGKKKEAQQVKEEKKVQTKENEGQKEFHIKDISELIGRQMNSAVNSKQNLQWREQKFGKGILTRFPPQPNGYLHIGHCKAMRFNFMQAKVSGGSCYLRFDDTNPIKQNQQYIDNIKQNIGWMGYQPWKVTHASDNFDHLYNYAIQLIKQGNAFVCSETKTEMKANRDAGLPSKNRDRSIQENLKLFEEMRLGLYEQNQLCLRAKIDCNHSNTTLRDPVIYRIRFASHPHAKDKWCIYPLYDFTHGICDSLQGISHSLCSLEFEIRRQLYYWFLQKLNLYKPSVWEYSRLNITNTVLSKRTLHKLIFDNLVDGWDDPRVLTINGMRRRGYPAEAINSFCDVIGVTRRGNENYINFSVLENEVRKFLDVNAPRTMAVLDPVQLHLEGVEDKQIQVPYFPKDEGKGKRKIRLSKLVYVDRQDVRSEDDKSFFGIAPNKVVGLKYVDSIFIKEVRSENGKVTAIYGQIDKQKRKPKSYLNWISSEESFVAKVRVYGLLFTIEKPALQPNFMEYLNKESKKIYNEVRCHKDLLANLKILDRFQFQRKGYFVVDKDSDIENGKVIWNKIVDTQDNKTKK